MALTPELQHKLTIAFRPHSPIEDPAAFQGRQEERDRVEEAIKTPGLHAIIYGERGAGKTSLANVASTITPRARVFCEKLATMADLFRAILLELKNTAGVEFTFDADTGTLQQGGLSLNVGRMTGNDLRRFLPTQEPLTIVLDELDRIENKKVVEGVAELCKNLSTYQQNVTLVMVGVADTADALLRGHASNIRNLRHVKLGRMTPDELRAILRHGERVVGVTFDQGVERNIIEVSDRFPYYLHLIATNAAKSALERDSALVQAQDYQKALVAAAQDCDEQLRAAYDDAILSVKGSEIYKRIVWSLALENENSITPRGICDRVNAFAVEDGDPEVSVQAVGQALKRLTQARRARIIVNKNPGFFGFSNPLMKGYVRLVRARE